jgi:hypothetical protein
MASAMYIHRVVIDANRINARGRIASMNQLGDYHRRGLIELLQTSTLPVEFLSAPPQRTKAAEYDVIGGSGFVYLSSGRVADAYPGTPINPSRFSEIEQLVFGRAFSSQRIRVRSQRDVLHIDQAWQHGVDYFVTDDKELLAGAPALTAAGFSLIVCTAEDCLTLIQKFFVQRYGTSDSAKLEATLRHQGPILVGSNSVRQIEFADSVSGDPLLSIRASENRILLSTGIIK